MWSIALKAIQALKLLKDKGTRNLGKKIVVIQGKIFILAKCKAIYRLYIYFITFIDYFLRNLSSIQMIFIEINNHVIHSYWWNDTFLNCKSDFIRLS